MGTLILSFLVCFAACGAQGKEPAPEPARAAPAPAPDPAPAQVLTPDECSSRGGQVKGDIGDGKVKCPDGQKDLGRVRTGIEGGVCCAPLGG